MGVKHIFAALFSILLILGCGVTGGGHKAGDGIIIQPPTTSTATINSLVVAGTDTVTYAPSGVAATNVYTDWATLYAAASSLTGPLTIYFPTGGTPPSGAYAFASTYLRWKGPSIALGTSNVPTVTLGTGVTFSPPPREIDNLIVNASGSTTPFAVTATGFNFYDLILQGRTRLSTSGSVPLVTVTGGGRLAVTMYGFSTLVTPTGAAASTVSQNGGGLFILSSFGGAPSIQANTIGASTGTVILLQENAEFQLASGQTGIVDTGVLPAPQLRFAQASQMTYTPTTAGDWPTTPTTAQGGLDTLAAASHVAATYNVRGVVDSNVASLSAFSVASRDGLTYTAGQTALLVLQTTTSQNGPWVVGAVAAGSAPLTRPSWWPAAGVMAAGATFVPNEGSHWRSRAWRVTTAGAVTVDSTAIDLYPQSDTAFAQLNGNAVMSSVATSALWKLANGISDHLGVNAIGLTQSTPPTEALELWVFSSGKPGTSSVAAYGPPSGTDIVLFNVTNF